MMANPIGAKIRISQPKIKGCKTMSVTHRALTMTEEQAEFQRHASI